MRILMITETAPPQHNGMVRQVGETLPELLRLGDQVLLIAPQHPAFPECWQGVPLIAAPSLPYLFDHHTSLGMPWLGQRARALVEAFCPEVIHAVNPIATGWSAVHLALRLQVPLLASFHTRLPSYTHAYGMGLFEEPLWSYCRLLHSYAHRTLCPSVSLQSELGRRGFEEVQVWPNGIDQEHFHPRHFSGAMRARLLGDHASADGQRVLLLLCVGRLAPEKGWRPVLTALRAVCEEYPPAGGTAVHLAFVGAGSEEAILRQQAQGLPVTFLGTLDERDLARAYASADVLLLPSTTDACSHVAGEALASGLPVVCARGAGEQEAPIREGVMGFSFDPTRPQTLVQVLRYLRASAEPLLAAMGGAARAAAGQRPGWSETTAILRGHYAALMSTHDGEETTRRLAGHVLC